MTHPFFELTDEHVGKERLRAFGRTWRIDYFMGAVFKSDVGKRVYLVGNILQVENDEQRRARLKKEKVR